MKHYISALLVAIGLIGLGLAVRSGINALAFNDRDVTVRGLAERMVEANQVTWPISYTISGDNLQELYNRLQADNATVVGFLTANGITDDEISVNPPDVYNAASNVYGGDRARYKYNFTSTITVSTSKVDTVRQLLRRQAELLRQGVAVNNNYINYQYTALNDIKPEMIAEATRNARLAADQFAQDSGSKVGKIKNARQGQFTIDTADSSTPHLMKVRVVSTLTYYLED